MRPAIGPTAILFSLLLCSSSPCAAAQTPIPEFYGIYAVAGESLYSLDSVEPALAALQTSVRVSRTEKDFNARGGRPTNVPALTGDVSVLIFKKDDSLDIAQDLALSRLPFVRRMTINANDSNFRRTFAIEAWVAGSEPGYYDLGTARIDLRFKPVKDHSEMVLAVPIAPLAPGVYLLSGKHVLTGGFLFAVLPLDDATQTACVDVTNPSIMQPWRTSPCVDEAPSSQLASSSEKLGVCGESEVESTVERVEGAAGAWTGELVQDSTRYPVNVSLAIETGGHVRGSTFYPTLNCSGTLAGSAQEGPTGVSITVTETVKGMDRLKCVSGSEVHLSSRAGKPGLVAEWYSKKGRLDASGTLCRPPG